MEKLTARGVFWCADMDQEQQAQSRSFDRSMLVAGGSPGDARYDETRRLMEDSIADDAAGFYPRFESTAENARALVFDNTIQFIAGERT